MLFNSLHFLFFFIVVTAAYFALPYGRRWVLLLASSCYFYMAFVPIYILILFFTIVVDYFAGIVIENSSGPRRKYFLILSLIANIGVLAVFKYFNFLNDTVSWLLHGFLLENPIPHLSIILPIGLSFHTFQAMSYTIEVYRGKQKSERHFGIYALYVMFYPQLVAGPIERPQNLLHQFRMRVDFDYDRVTDGLRLVAWGLFKKIVIADRLGIVVDTVYNNPYLHDCLDLIIATVFFSFQIFCDFSGYSDIAIGTALVMGFKLMKNFDQPYQARSVPEFWRRWHISLSSWFRDYLYISMGGNRVELPRWYFNIFIVFLMSGLWHGANWTFVAWGVIHGIYVVGSVTVEKIKARLNRPSNNWPLLSTALTFVLVSFAWIFFRSDNLETAFHVASTIITGLPEMMGKAIRRELSIGNLGISHKDLAISLSLIVFLETIHFINNKINVAAWFKRRPVYIRWGVYYAAVSLIMSLGVFQNRQFIYFQF